VTLSRILEKALIWLLRKCGRGLIYFPVDILPADNNWHEVSMNVTFHGKKTPKYEWYIDGFELKKYRKD